MSKKTKIIVGLLVAVLLIGGGVFGYLIYTGKIALHASSKPKLIRNEVTITYPNNSDPGRFVSMTVRNITKPTRNESDGDVKNGKATRVHATASQTIEYECKFISTKKIYNPTVFLGTKDPSNTNLAKTMTFKNIEANRYMGSTTCWGSDNSEYKFDEKKGFSNKYGYDGYNKPAAYWYLVGGWNYMNTGCPVTAKVTMQVKDAASLKKSGYKSAGIVKAGWAAGWQWQTKIWSGSEKYGFNEVKVFYNNPQPAAKVDKSQIHYQEKAPYTSKDAMFTSMSINDINNNQEATDSNGRLLVKRGDEIVISAVIKSNVDKFYNPTIYFGTADSNSNFLGNMTNVQNITMMVGTGVPDKVYNNDGSTVNINDVIKVNKSSNFTYGGYNKPAIYWSILGDGTYYLKKGDLLPLNFHATVNKNTKSGTIIKFGWRAGWYLASDKTNQTRIWSGDVMYSFNEMIVQ